jgi:formylglycine-generating enzyme required for sulfatase activity
MKLSKVLIFIKLLLIAKLINPLFLCLRFNKYKNIMKKISNVILVLLISYNTYSQTLQQCTTDNNNDGVTNTTDFLNLVGQFGQNCAPLGTVSSFTCSDFINSGTLIQGSEASNVSSIISYTGGNGGDHNGQVVSSTGVTGLYAALSSGTFAVGAGSLTYLIFGTPTSSGTASFDLNIGGQTCTLTRTVNGSGSGPLNIETSLIPAGTFTMGSPTTEPQSQSDEEQHQVTLSAFRMSKYETSNAQFAAFLNAKSIGSNGLYALGAYPTQILIYAITTFGLTWTGTQWQPVAGKENFPVVGVTWYGATEFATYAGGRLPTEAEWEYACRGNTTTAFNTGVCLNNFQANYDWDFPLTDCSNTNTTITYQTQAINSYSPNAYGLYNMHGNVQEWCSDWYGPYSTTAQTNPTGASSGTFRVSRGGSWYDRARVCRSADRSYANPNIWDNRFGIRLVFAP